MGYGRDGGQEGLWEYIKPKWQEGMSKIGVLDVDLSKFGTVYAAGRPAINGHAGAVGKTPNVDRTYKLYYGGAQKRPDGNYSGIVRDVEGNPCAQVGQSNRKDVRNAVEAAIKAQPGWEKKSGFNRAQILFSIGTTIHLGKGWIVRGTTTRRLPYWANGLFYPIWNRLYQFTAYL